ncbi:MAG TPA: biopolymer transporter ExbD [Desulfomonilia bacterium]|nr:biopolymer transporter ExbD [Desulfomonilia bacterium]
MRFRQNKKNKTRFYIDTTPLVNVVLLLLIFFLFSMGVSRGLNQGSTTGKTGFPSTKPVAVVISPGQVVINGRPLDEQALKNLPRNRDIIITATKDIPYVKVMNILDALRTSGHTRISLATKPTNN